MNSTILLSFLRHFRLLYGRTWKLDWLRKFAAFANGIPSHDCIANVVSRLSPKGFQACFRSWIEAVSEATKDKVIAVDGKTARGSRDRKRARKALHAEQIIAQGGDYALGLKGNQSALQEGVEDFFKVALPNASRMQCVAIGAWKTVCTGGSMSSSAKTPVASVKAMLRRS